MFLTDEEKQDRTTGPLGMPAGLANFFGSALFLPPKRPKKIEQVAGQETEDPLDDLFADKYTGNLFKNEQFPTPRSPGEVSIRKVPVTNEMAGIEDDPTGQYTIDPALKAYQDYRFTKTGTNPIGNLLGVLELPTVVSLLPLLGAGVKGGFNLIRRRLKSAGRSADEIAAIEKQFNTIFNPETRQAIQGAKSQEEAVNIIGERMNLLNMGPAGGRIAEDIKKAEVVYKMKPTAKLNADDFFAARDNLAKKLGRNPTREELVKELDITTSALDHKLTRLGIRDELNLSTAPRPGGASVTVKRIEEMNEVSKNFDSKDWTTWKGSVMVKKYMEDGKDIRRFVFPDDPKVKQAIINEINKIKGKVRGSDGGLGELANLLDLTYGNFTAAVRTLQKETKLISDWKKSDYSKGTKFRQKLDSAWRKANPEASKELNLLKREVKKLNDELGLTGDNAFEVDHIRAIVDDFENTGVADFSIKNVQIIPKFINAGGVKRVGPTLMELPDAKSKMVLFENAKYGIRKLYSDLSKKGLSRTERADILREIKNKWSQWEQLTKEHNVLFDFTDYKGKLPEEMLIKNKPDDFDAFNQLYDIADDLIGKRAAGVREEYIESLLSKGGRVGYKEGGTVKLKINPKDYIVNYSDGTKLYKINSFIRDVANQVD
jgi:hypothetical protein